MSERDSPLAVDNVLFSPSNICQNNFIFWKFYSYLSRIYTRTLLTSDVAEFLIHMSEWVCVLRARFSQFLMINDNELCFDGFGPSRELNYLVRWIKAREFFTLYDHNEMG